MNQIQPPNGIVRKAISSNYSLSYADRYVGTRSVTITTTLPLATGYTGKEFIVADETGNSSANITVTATSPDHVNGAASISILGSYGHKNIISDGTNWFAR